MVFDTIFKSFLGAGGRTRTDTVSRRILSAVRLPFRHTGICAKGIANIIQQIALAGKTKLKIFPSFAASRSTGLMLCDVHP